MNISNNLSFLDLFAGAGGFSKGFEMANFKLISAIEIDDWAVDTLKANHPHHKIVHADIKEFNKISTFHSHKPDFIIGGPPCQGFSNASSNKDPNDPRNSLFVDFAKWVEILQPSIFVMENVKGILTRRNSVGVGILSIICKTFRNLGYYVDIWNLNAAEYGVPQIRERVFFVGNKIGISIPPPPKSHYLLQSQKKSNLKKAITVREAISDLPIIYAGQGSEKQSYINDPEFEYQKWAREKSDFVYNHVAMNHTNRLIERFKLIQKGNNLDELPEEFRVRKRNGNGNLSETKFNSNYRHLKMNSISNTIPASFYSSFIHPIIPRNITAREAARIQSFPDDYIFKGKRTLISKKLLMKTRKIYSERLSQYNQIGNAVPPLLAEAIGNHLKLFI